MSSVISRVISWVKQWQVWQYSLTAQLKMCPKLRRKTNEKLIISIQILSQIVSWQGIRWISPTNKLIRGLKSCMSRNTMQTRQILPSSVSLLFGLKFVFSLFIKFFHVRDFVLGSLNHLYVYLFADNLTIMPFKVIKIFSLSLYALKKNQRWHKKEVV